MGWGVRRGGEQETRIEMCVSMKMERRGVFFRFERKVKLKAFNGKRLFGERERKVGGGGTNHQSCKYLRLLLILGGVSAVNELVSQVAG